MEYLHLFETKSAHDAVYNGANYKEPWVGYIENDDIVTFNKIDYRNIVGSIAYFDGSKVEFVGKNAWTSSLGTPIGVVVIPASHMQDGKCRVMSLCNMSYLTPDTGTLGVGNDNYQTYGFNLMWGVYNSDTSLTNYQSKMFSDEQTSNGLPYLPSDLWKGRTSIDIDGIGTYSMTTIDNSVDTETAWWSKIGEREGPNEPPFVISPYAADGSRNALADTAGQALADMDGKSNTSVLVNLSAINDTYSGGAFENAQANYPAAFACNLFSTMGTSQGDWYLPSMGELAYLFVREGTINQSLAALGNSAVQVGNLTNATSSFGESCWSSSEYGSNHSLTISEYGAVTYRSKFYSNDYFRVRAFCAFDI